MNLVDRSLFLGALTLVGGMPAPRFGAEALRYAIYSGLGFDVVSVALFALAAAV